MIYLDNNNNDNNELSVALILPCIPKHLMGLHKVLFKFLKNNTGLPDEIIVSLCGCESISKREITFLKEDFNDMVPTFKLVTTDKLVPAGKTRNIGASTSKCDIFIFHDGDDPIHPQKIELIKYFFMKYPKIVHINHLLVPIHHQWTYYIPEQISYITPEQVYRDWKPFGYGRHWYGAVYNYGPVAVGMISIRSEVFQAHIFPEDHGAEDLRYCVKLLTTYKQSIVIKSALSKYDKVTEKKWIELSVPKIPRHWFLFDIRSNLLWKTKYINGLPKIIHLLSINANKQRTLEQVSKITRLDKEWITIIYSITDMEYYINYHHPHLSRRFKLTLKQGEVASNNFLDNFMLSRLLPNEGGIYLTDGRTTSSTGKVR